MSENTSAMLDLSTLSPETQAKLQALLNNPALLDTATQYAQKQASKQAAEKAQKDLDASIVAFNEREDVKALQATLAAQWQNARAAVDAKGKALALTFKPASITDIQWFESDPTDRVNLKSLEAELGAFDVARRDGKYTVGAHIAGFAEYKAKQGEYSNLAGQAFAEKNFATARNDDGTMTVSVENARNGKANGGTRVIAKGYKVGDVTYATAEGACKAMGVTPTSHAPDGTPYWAAALTPSIKAGKCERVYD